MYPLGDALQEVVRLQQQLATRSRYYGYVLREAVGTDTLPLCLTLVDGTRLQLCRHGVETAYFRLEQVGPKMVTLRLLCPTFAGHDVVRLQKTELFGVVEGQQLASVQLLDVRLMRDYFTESKW